jgi:hypothetical protein
MKAEVAKDPEGYIPIETIKSFHLVQSHSIAEITEAAKLSPLLVVSEDGTKIKRKNPLPPRNVSEEIRRTIFVNSISEVDTRETLTEAFKEFGEICFLSIPVHKGDSTREFDQGKNKGIAFIEYETEESALNAVKNYQDPHGVIRVLPKQQWLADNDKNARQKTREHNKKVKQNNNNRGKRNNREDNFEPQGALTNGENQTENKNQNKNEELGLILHFTGAGATDTKVVLRKQFQDICRMGIAFFDYVDGADSGYIRLRNAQDCKFIIIDLENKKLASLRHISVRKLNPTEEQEYKSKIPEKKVVEKKRKDE